MACFSAIRLINSSFQTGLFVLTKSVVFERPNRPSENSAHRVPNRVKTVSFLRRLDKTRKTRNEKGEKRTGIFPHFLLKNSEKSPKKDRHSGVLIRSLAPAAAPDRLLPPLERLTVVPGDRHPRSVNRQGAEEKKETHFSVSYPPAPQGSRCDGFAAMGGPLVEPEGRAAPTVSAVQPVGKSPARLFRFSRLVTGFVCTGRGHECCQIDRLGSSHMGLGVGDQMPPLRLLGLRALRSADGEPPCLADSVQMVTPTVHLPVRPWLPRSQGFPRGHASARTAAPRRHEIGRAHV